MGGWILAIDFGTTSTAAARRVGDRVETIQLQGGPRMPSMVFWREGTGGEQTGRLVFGQEADQLSGVAPWALEKTPKRRLGEEYMLLGEKQLRVVEVVAAILREVHTEALQLSGGEPAAEIRLTHPARWGRARLASLKEAARIAGLGDPVLVPEPVAAAVYFASERLGVGENVAVYDLGGGTFDTAVLRRTEDSFEVVGRTGGDEELGGEDFDDLLYRHLGDQLDGDAWAKMRDSTKTRERAWAQANRELLRHARLAKEGLSRNPEYEFYLPGPVDQEMHATQEEFEGLIGPAVRGTVSELERTILASGLKPEDLAAIYLAGGSSRIPLVARTVQSRLGVAAQHLDDPKAVIALGAARLAHKAAADSGVTRVAAAGTAAAGQTVAAASPGADETAAGREVPKPQDTVAPADAAPAPVRAEPAGGAAPPAKPPARAAGSAGTGNGPNWKIIGPVVAGVVAVGVILAFVLGSGGGGDPTTVTTTSEKVETVAGNPKDNPGYQKVLALVDPRYRKTCTPEDSSQWEPGANAGVTCEIPGIRSFILETFDTPSSMNAAFRRFLGAGIGTGSCESEWNVKGTWHYTDTPKRQEGQLACHTYTDNGGGDELSWSQVRDNMVGWIDAGKGQHDLLLQTWDDAT